MKTKINQHTPTLIALLVVLLLGLMAFRLSAQSVPKTQPDSVKTEQAAKATQCQHICKDGHRCKKTTKNKEGLCYIHTAKKEESKNNNKN